jgi:hypothetical protein
MPHLCTKDIGMETHDKRGNSSGKILDGVGLVRVVFDGFNRLQYYLVGAALWGRKIASKTTSISSNVSFARLAGITRLPPIAGSNS